MSEMEVLVFYLLFLHSNYKSFFQYSSGKKKKTLETDTPTTLSNNFYYSLLVTEHETSTYVMNSLFGFTSFELLVRDHHEILSWSLIYRRNICHSKIWKISMEDHLIGCFIMHYGPFNWLLKLLLYYSVCSTYGKANSADYLGSVVQN